MKTGKSFDSSKTGIIKLSILTLLFASINFSVYAGRVWFLIACGWMAIGIPEDISLILAFGIFPIVNLILSIILLDSFKLWLCSIPVQLLIYKLFLYLEASTIGWSRYILIMAIFLAIQALGLGIKLIYRKTKSKKSRS